MTHSDQDRRLLQDCLAGRPGAWEAFVAAFRPYLAGVCRRALVRCGLPSGFQEVEDAVQDVLVVLLEDNLKALRAYGGRASVAGYLASVAVHRVSKEGNLPPPTLPRARQDPGPGEILEAKESGERLKSALAVLPPKARLALSLKADGAGMEEIGLALGVSKGAAAQLLFRARALLRERLGRP